MAPTIRRVQSQEIINVSLDSFSDPVLKNTPPRSAPSPVNDETGEEDRIEETLTYEPPAGDACGGEVHPTDVADGFVKGPPVALGRDKSAQAATTSREPNPATHDTQAIGAHLYSSATAAVDTAGEVKIAQLQEAEEDLYGATPPRKSQIVLLEPGERRDLTHVPTTAVALHSTASIETATKEGGSEAAPPQTAPQSTVQHLATHIHAVSTALSLAEHATSHTTVMALGSKETRSTGKLPSGKGALAALQARKQRSCGHSREASTKQFQKAVAKEGPATKLAGARSRPVGSVSKGPSGATKVKDTMKGDPILRTTAKGSPSTRSYPRESPQIKPADRKRKAGSGMVDGESKSTDAPDHVNKRAKPAMRNRIASPTVSAAHHSDHRPSSDVFDLPGSPTEADPIKAARKRISRPVLEAATAAIGIKTAAPEKLSATVKEKPSQMPVDEHEGQRRQLRPRKPMRQPQIEEEADGKEEVVVVDGAGPHHAKKPDAEASSACDSVKPHEKIAQVVRRSEHLQGNEARQGQEVNSVGSRPITSIEPAVSLPDNANPTGSQFNAIVLSDGSELSSSIEYGSPPPGLLPDVSPEVSRRPATRLETPAAMQSSPPRAFSYAGSQSRRGTGRSRNTQIIGFGKAGPLNQGSVPKSWHTNASVPPSTIPLNWGSATGSVINMARKKASSVATSVRSGKSNVAAPPSNVAYDVHDALAGLAKSRPQAPVGTTFTVNAVQLSVSASEEREHGSGMHATEVDHEDHDSGFNTINDLENFINSPSPSQQLHAELEQAPTASQIIMPPPQRKIHSPQMATEVKTSEPNRATAVSRPFSTAYAATQSRSRTGISQTAQRDPIIATELVGTGATTSISSGPYKSAAKQPMPADASEGPPPKRAKATSSKVEIDTESFSSNIAISNKAEAGKSVDARRSVGPKELTTSHPKTTTLVPAQPEIEHTATAFKKQSVKFATAVGSKDHFSEPQPPEEPSPFKTADPLPRPINPVVTRNEQPRRLNNARRKSNRQLSQNSQTVDLNGSPVPPDMDVAEASTVLETFSQQADESSVRSQQTSPHLKTPMILADHIEDAAYSVPPSHQPPALPSNKKALPGPSGSSSKTMRHVKLTEAELDLVMNRRIEMPAGSDPFASSREESQGFVYGAQQGEHLLQRTLNLAYDLGQPAVEKATRSNIGLRSPVQKVPTKPPETVTAPEFTNKFASDLEKQVAAIREHIAFTRAVDEDPDKTLVDDCSQETEVSKEVSEISSPVSCSGGTPEMFEEPEPSSQSSEGDEEDLRVWRKGLKLHQLGLYEELVRIARVVTGYVAGQEASAEIMIDDNYRRELILIEREEEVQKKQYKQYISNLQQKKNEKIRELLDLEKVLLGVLDASAASWEEHCRGRAEREHANRKIDALIASCS